MRAEYSVKVEWLYEHFNDCNRNLINFQKKHTLKETSYNLNLEAKVFIGHYCVLTQYNKILLSLPDNFIKLNEKIALR